ncbi:MAG TPA: inorganic phosphate transporter [Cyclobacteriaceae bacterium]|nr:inorganic phosphate transporter [Cyclobacteriaceae bacterium]
MFELDLSYSVLLVICLVAACGFEFVNGFHDTANAVATVIYTNTLRPWIAVILSAICNFLGVWLGGITVAIGIVNLLPVESLVDQNIAHSLSMVMALLISAIFWNLFTWYFGIPCSSSHTLIGSILGVGIAFSLIPGANETAVNWSKAQDIGLSLLLSPLIGFSVTIILMFIIRNLTKKTSYGSTLFKEPKKNAPPPPWIRTMLILTCTSVSFSHGSNDGQKGVGLVMLILIGIIPSYFALNQTANPSALVEPLGQSMAIINTIDDAPFSATDRTRLSNVKTLNSQLLERVDGVTTVNAIPRNERFLVRKDIMILDREVRDILNMPDLTLSPQNRATLTASLGTLRSITDYSPKWVILLISVSLGTGTMIGWKRIVKTIGEKIGKEHLTYAQGASAELVAASTIGLSTSLGLPVSTTHVLSSGIAGSMVANKGIKNLQANTVRNIVIAWVLTLPVVMVLSGTLFLIFRAIS